MFKGGVRIPSEEQIKTNNNIFNINRSPVMGEH